MRCLMWQDPDLNLPQHDPDLIPQAIMPVLDFGFDIEIGSGFLDYDDSDQVQMLRSVGIEITLTRKKLPDQILYGDITDAYSRTALLKLWLFEKAMPVSTNIEQSSTIESYYNRNTVTPSYNIG